MVIDQLTKDAITHTRHCLTGCGIGEIIGSIIGASLLWHNVAQTALAVVLAFLFGYGLTFYGARKTGASPRQAFKIALAVDTISIISMETIDNVLEYLIPGAMNAYVNEFVFWWALALSLAVAFVLTVPINRFMMSKGISGNHHNHHNH